MLHNDPLLFFHFFIPDTNKQIADVISENSSSSLHQRQTQELQGIFIVFWVWFEGLQTWVRLAQGDHCFSAVPHQSALNPMEVF